MVAISLHRGKLHIPSLEPPRKWLMPTPTISIHDFRRLIHRRSISLSLLPFSSTPPPLTKSSGEIQKYNAGSETSGAIENSNLEGRSSEAIGNPNLCSELVADEAEEINATGGGISPSNSLPHLEVGERVSEGIGNPNLCTDIIVRDSAAVAAMEIDIDTEKEADVDLDNRISILQVNGNYDGINEKESRKREVEEKLQILNEKKHNLVQALKQILNAEEELTRRSNVQANRPPLPLQVDVSNDSGSMTRHATPRTGSDVNVAVVDVEGGDNAVNQISQPQQLLRVNSTSPSAESALRKPPFSQNNAASYSSRAAMVSPSRFAPSGNHVQSSNMPTVSVSGTNYIPSSPSPAASVGTSCFRDTRHPSPWS